MSTTINIKVFVAGNADRLVRRRTLQQTLEIRV